MHTSSAKDVFTHFVNFYFVDRDPASALLCLTPDVEWYEAGAVAPVRGIAAVQKSMESALHAASENASAAVCDIQLTPRNAETATACCTLQYAQSAGGCVNGTCILTDGAWKICTLHLPAPTSEYVARQLIDTALRGYDVSVWEWDIPAHKCYQSIHSSRCDSVGLQVYENFPEVMFETRHYHADSVALARAVFASVERGDKTVEAVLHTYDSRTGEYWWESVCYTTLYNEAGIPVRAVAVGKDITRQKQLELDLLCESQRYETLVNSIPGGVGMYRMDEKFTPVYLNDRVSELCGMTPAEYLQAIQHSALAVIHPEDAAGLAAELQNAWQEKRKVNYVYRLMQKQGGFRWTHVSGE